MRLSDFLKYEDIVIQCHDNPDADALASGYGLYSFFEKNGKKTRFIYGGKFEVQKSNLVLMMSTLNIPAKHVDSLDEPDLLITVDCQYGEGNVTRFAAKKVAVIDHHQVSGELPEMSDVRSNLGSCSTVVKDLLEAEGINVNDDKGLATALFYGLLTDTNGFAEISHPLDKDLRDGAAYDKSLVRMYRNSNLSFDEMNIAGEALLGHSYFEDDRFAIVEAAPCDPNILGMISDLLLEVHGVDTCLVYSILPFGVKLSVRSCIKETKASDLAAYITAGVGSGGGHVDKAGGFIQKELLGNLDPKDFLKDRMQQYFANSQVIYAAEYEADVSKMKEYKKLKLPVGYIKAMDVMPVGTMVCVRTLEGDLEMEITDDLYFLIGVEGEVYTNREEKLLRSYELTDSPYEANLEYEPTVKDVVEGRIVGLMQHAKMCIPTGEVHIYACPIDKITKIFTAWDNEKYMQGKPGDYQAVRMDDLHDTYIIRKDIFMKTYAEV